MAQLQSKNPENSAEPSGWANETSGSDRRLVELIGQEAAATVSRGRIGFAAGNIMRTKPGRLDAPSTISMSCSDKICSWIFTGIQGGLLSSILETVYLDQIVVSVVIGDDGDPTITQLRKSLVGRLQQLANGAKFPLISVTSEEFTHSIERAAAFSQETPVSAAEAISWIDGLGVEIIVNGVRQGTAVVQSTAEKPLKLRAQSRLSKANLYATLATVTNVSSSYHNFKQNQEEYQIRKTLFKQTPNFTGWIVAGRPFESFPLQ